MNDTNEILEGEIVEAEFLAPVLKNAKELTTLVNTDDLIKKYSALSEIDINLPAEEIAENFLEIEKGFKAFRKARTAIERSRKEIGDPAYQFHKKVIEIAKDVQKVINPYEQKLKALVDKVENEEKRKQREAEELEETRISNIKAIINRYKMLPMESIGKSSKVIQEVLDLAELPTVEALEELYDEALIIYDASMTQIRVMLDNQILVENAEEIKKESERKAKLIQEEEDKKLQAERDLLSEQQAQFNRDKKEFDDKQKAIKEAADLEKASKEADELQEKQRLDKENQIKIDEENHDAMVLETMKVLNSVSDNVILLDMIISNEVPNLKWVV